MNDESEKRKSGVRENNKKDANLLSKYNSELRMRDDIGYEGRDVTTSSGVERTLLSIFRNHLIGIATKQVVGKLAFSKPASTVSKDHFQRQTTLRGVLRDERKRWHPNGSSGSYFHPLQIQDERGIISEKKAVELVQIIQSLLDGLGNK